MNTTTSTNNTEVVDFDKYIRVGAKFLCVDASHRECVIPHGFSYQYIVGEVYTVERVSKQGFPTCHMTQSHMENKNLVRKHPNARYKEPVKQWNREFLETPKMSDDREGRVFMYPVMMPIEMLSPEDIFYITLGGEDNIDGGLLIRNNKKLIDRYVESRRVMGKL